MECLFGRELPMERCRRYEIQRIVLAACVIAIGWRATALRIPLIVNAVSTRS